MLYVYVQFDQGGPHYAYHRPDHIAEADLAEGAIVEVETRRGKARVRVSGLSLDPPRDGNNRLIETKPLSRLIEPAQPPAASTDG